MSKTEKSAKKKAKSEALAQVNDPVTVEHSKKEKKRKRDDAGETEEPKKSKKSKKHTDTEPTPSEDVVADRPLKKTKKSKRKAADEEPEVEVEAPTIQEAETSSEPKEKKEKRAKKPKKSKDSKTDVETAPVEQNGTATTEVPVQNGTAQPDFISLEADGTTDVGDKEMTPVQAKKKSRKQRIAAKKANNPQEDPAAKADEAENTAEEEPSNGAEENGTSGKKSRFVVFVGNLPFNATKEELQTHFAKIAPTDIRIMTDKVTKKSKGFAFVEFDRFDRMETCLKLYNHSMFGEGKKGRKINCELTAGGGGNTEARKSKIQAKNEKLEDERQREREKREELEAKKKERSDKKAAKANKSKKGGEDEKVADKPADDHSGIHPSRLAQMQKPAASGWYGQRY